MKVNQKLLRERVKLSLKQGGQIVMSLGQIETKLHVPERLSDLEVNIEAALKRVGDEVLKNIECVCEHDAESEGKEESA